METFFVPFNYIHRKDLRNGLASTPLMYMQDIQHVQLISNRSESQHRLLTVDAEDTTKEPIKEWVTPTITNNLLMNNAEQGADSDGATPTFNISSGFS